LTQTLNVEKQVLARAKDDRTMSECQQRISMLDAELGQMFNFRGAIHWKRQNWSTAEENFLNSYQHFATSSQFQQGLIDDITAVTRSSSFAFFELLHAFSLSTWQMLLRQ
jgi:metal-dependent amidase/aminoacylase/carboxypeptidase family protein